MQAGLQLRSWQTGCMWGIESIEKKRSGFERVQDRVRAKEWQDFLVAMRSGVTPVPISNTMVKTWTADGTALETVWESRWPPNLKEKSKGRSAAGVKNKYGQRWATTYHRQPHQQGSAVKKLVSPVIRDLKGFRFLMTDEKSVRCVPWKLHTEKINEKILNIWSRHPR